MSVLIGLLVLTVALGGGGYDPWATLVLEIGAAVIGVWLVLDVVTQTADAQRQGIASYLKQRKRLPAGSRRPGLTKLIRVLSFGCLPVSTGTEVTIVDPESAKRHRDPEGEPREYFFPFGYPFKRSGLEAPLVLLTGWICLSLIPIDLEWMTRLSPEAVRFYQETSALTGAVPNQAKPSSVAPFLTIRSGWLWIGCLLLFYGALRVAGETQGVRRLSLGLFLGGSGLGAWGVLEWLNRLRSHLDPEVPVASLRASASFGNPNHYAAFLEMILLCGIGWLGAVRFAARSRPLSGHLVSRRLGRQEAKARLALAGLAVVFVALGILFSLSRSGIVSALAGSMVFALLVGRTPEGRSSRVIDIVPEGGGRGRSAADGRRRRSYGGLCLVLAVVGLAVWIGIGPVLHRFELATEEWAAESQRPQIWRDSLGAARDFWLTGSGLSTYRYVTSGYRTFSGPTVYSWAHNDYLQLLIELGLPGALLLVWLGIGVVTAAARTRRKLDERPELLRLHAGYCGAASAIALHSFTDFSLHLPANLALLSIVLAVVVGMEPAVLPPDQSPGARGTA